MHVVVTLNTHERSVTASALSTTYLPPTPACAPNFTPKTLNTSLQVIFYVKGNCFDPDFVFVLYALIIKDWGHFHRAIDA